MERANDKAREYWQERRLEAQNPPIPHPLPPRSELIACWCRRVLLGKKG